MRPSASDECDFEKGRAEYGRLPSSFGTSTPLSTTHSLSPHQTPSCSPHSTTIFSPLSTSTTSPTNLSFVSLPQQLRLSQVDTQLQNIQFERKVKTKWIFQHEYSRYQKPTLNLPDAHRFTISEKMQVTKKYSYFYVLHFCIMQSKCLCIYFCSRVPLMNIRIIKADCAQHKLNRFALLFRYHFNVFNNCFFLCSLLNKLITIFNYINIILIFNYINIITNFITIFYLIILSYWLL